MARYDRGYDYGRGYRTGGWSDPWGGRPDGAYPRRFAGERPRVGGYDGFQGGSGGIVTGGGRGGNGRGSGYGRDYWWLGSHGIPEGGRSGVYDRAYRDLDRQSHPRFSPVGGTYAAMGGQYAYHRPPRPLREDTWFSDWTRWF